MDPTGQSGHAATHFGESHPTVWIDNYPKACVVFLHWLKAEVFKASILADEQIPSQTAPTTLEPVRASSLSTSVSEVSPPSQNTANPPPKEQPNQQTSGPAEIEGPLPPARHSDDFRSVHWFGYDYSFSKIQAPC